MPPHLGHVHLCDAARAQVDRLTILVGSLPDDPIPGDLRATWMRELFPDCDVVHHGDPVPQAPEEHPEFWRIWRELIERVAPGPYDKVFASEAYGARLAAELGARFVPVDPARGTVPVSASDIRAAPWRHWRYLPHVVRPFYAKRICLFGPESTGKSTMATQLAARFRTICVPEYGRTYTDIFGTDCDADDLRRIADGQRAAILAAERQCNRIVVCDTDPVLTQVWATMLLGDRLPELEATPLADLYLLLDIDVAWADDGTRYFPDAERRQAFFDACQAEFERRGARYAIIRGDGDRRLMAGVAAITDAFPDLD